MMFNLLSHKYYRSDVINSFVNKLSTEERIYVIIKIIKLNNSKPFLSDK